MTKCERMQRIMEERERKKEEERKAEEKKYTYFQETRRKLMDFVITKCTHPSRLTDSSCDIHVIDSVTRLREVYFFFNPADPQGIT